MKKKVIKNFVIYNIPDVIAKFMPFISVPIATAYLTLTDFGHIALFGLALVPFKILTEFGQSYVLYSLWFKINKRARKQLLFNVLFTSALLNLVAIVILTLAKNSIFAFIVGKDWEVIKVLFIALIIKVMANIPDRIFIDWTMLEQKAKLNAVIQTVNIIVTYSIYLTTIILTKNYLYVIWADVLVSLFIGLIKLIIILPNLNYVLQKRYLSSIYKIGSPIFIRSFFTQIKSRFDKFYVVKLFGSADFALYNFSGQFNALFSTFDENYEKSYSPFFYKQMAKNNLDLSNIRRLLFLRFYALFLFISFLFLFGEKIITFFTHGVFTQSFPLVLLYCCVLLISSPFVCSSLVIIHHQKTFFLLIATIIQAAVSIILCVILIPPLGAKGAVVAIWFAILIYSVMQFVMKSKLMNQWFIERETIFYVIIFHLMIYLKVFTKTEVNFLFILVPAIILTLHVLIIEKKYLTSILKNTLKKFVDRS